MYKLVKSSIILKIGGSVIYDNSLNVNQVLLDKLKEWYFRKKDDYQNIVIVVGGGSELLMNNEKSIMVSGGLKVGWSTDMDAAVFADILEESRIIKVSNIDYIYDRDPGVVEDAVAIKDMTWDEYFKLFDIQEDSTHSPNKNIPIDVECARFCKKKEISFWISGGDRIKEANVFEDIITEGTLVHP